MGNEAGSIIHIRRRKERVHREDRDLISVMGRKVRRAAWDHFISGHIDLYDQPACASRKPVFLTSRAEASFHLSELAAITKDESLGNLFAFVAAELQEDKPSIPHKILSRFARIALSRTQEGQQRIAPISLAA